MDVSKLHRLRDVLKTILGRKPDKVEMEMIAKAVIDDKDKLICRTCGRVIDDNGFCPKCDQLPF
jgi:rubrerythrin